MLDFIVYFKDITLMELILKVSAALEMKLETGCGVARWQRMYVCKSFEVFCFSEVILFNLTKRESKAFVFSLPSSLYHFLSLCHFLCCFVFGVMRIEER